MRRMPWVLAFVFLLLAAGPVLARTATVTFGDSLTHNDLPWLGYGTRCAKTGLADLAHIPPQQARRGPAGDVVR